MTQWTEHASAELAIASKPELIRKLFEKTGCLPNTDLDQATRTEFTFVLDNELETLCEDHSGDYHYTCSDWPSMESQMVQNSRGKIVFTFNNFFDQAQDRFPSSSPKSSHIQQICHQSQDRFSSSSLKLSHVQHIFFQGHGVF